MPIARPVRTKYSQPDNIARFIAELFRNGGNATFAVETLYEADKLSKRRAGVIATTLRKHPMVVEAMARQLSQALTDTNSALNRFAATKDRTADELARLAFAQMRDFVDLSTVTDPTDPKKRRQVLRVRDFGEITGDAHKAIVEVTQKADGTVTIKMGDKLAALNSLAKLMGWVSDKPETPGQTVAFVVQRG